MPSTEPDDPPSNGASEPRSSLRRREFVAGAASLAALGTAGCLNVLDSSEGSGSSGDWPTYRGDWQRTGLAPADAGPGESLSVAWETSFLDVIEAREGVSAQRFDAVGDDYNRYVAAGMCWDVTLSDDVVLCTMDYRLYEGDAEESNWGGVVAMDAASGSVEWTIAGLSGNMQAPTVVDGRLYHFVLFPVDADVEGSHVLVADVSTGSVEARHEVPGGRRYAPTITENGIYHRSPRDAQEDGIVSIDPDSGGRDWLVGAPPPQAQMQPFTVADGSVVYGAHGGDSDQRSILALDPETGDEQWRWTFDVPDRPGSVATVLLGPPSIVDGNGYVAGRWADFWSDDLTGSALRSFELDGGDEQWTFRPEGVPHEELSDALDSFPCQVSDGCEMPQDLAALQGTPLVIDDLVVVPGYGQAAPNGHSHPEYRHLYAVSAADGSLQWSVPGFATSAVAAGDVIYTRLVGDRVAAISTDGTVLDTVETSAGPSWGRPPAIGHGRVYTSWGSNEGRSSRSPDTVVAIE